MVELIHAVRHDSSGVTINGGVDSSEIDTVSHKGEESALVENGGKEIMIEDFTNPKLNWGTLSNPIMSGQSDSAASMCL